MSLSGISLVILLIALGVSWLSWIAVSPIFLGIMALVTAGLMILEGLAVVSYHVGPKRVA